MRWQARAVSPKLLVVRQGLGEQAAFNGGGFDVFTCLAWILSGSFLNLEAPHDMLNERWGEVKEYPMKCCVLFSCQLPGCPSSLSYGRTMV
jgi:hypothetical protein